MLFPTAITIVIILINIIRTGILIAIVVLLIRALLKYLKSGEVRK